MFSGSRDGSNSQSSGPFGAGGLLQALGQMGGSLFGGRASRWGGGGERDGADCTDTSVASPGLGQKAPESIHAGYYRLRGVKVRGSKNVSRMLDARQLLGRMPRGGSTHFGQSRGVIHAFRDRLDLDFSGVPNLVLALEDAVVRHRESLLSTSSHGPLARSRGGREGGEAVGDWAAVVQAVANISQKLLKEIPSDGAVDQVSIDRETFAAFGGPETLIQLFQPPFTTRDARDLTPDVVQQRSEVWNDSLVILRELCYSVPEANRLFGTDLVLFLFTLMSQPAFFDHAVGLIEEILANQSQTFYIGQVPNLLSLLQGFSLRQLAHFCRVLALLVFEPEDRHLMESSKVLKSLEILQLRRDRMVRPNNIIDKNQAIILGFPEILARLVKLLKVMNYSPSLNRLSHSLVAGLPAFEMLYLLGNIVEQRDWGSIPQLESLADQYQPPTEPSTPSTIPSPPLSAPLGAAPAADGMAGGGVAPHGGGGVPMADLMAILAPLLSNSSPPDLNIRQIIHLVHAVQALNTGNDHNPAASIILRRLNRRTPPRSPADAHNELQFNALLLTPHQVEVLFVLCTLLGGRRKLDVQQSLADQGLIGVLTDMFDRLSWGCPKPEGPSPLERLHGPGCECNPESALRVQFLRLVHNFCDRDCENNTHKLLLLSPEERQMLQAGKTDPEADTPKGLLTKIIHVLMLERADSIYRFWLASCVESYLRGSCPEEQVFVAKTGLLGHLIREIISDGLKCAGSLQTAFDLLGELSKCNLQVLRMLESSLTDSEFRRFMEVAVTNLVDSNVFIRSIILSLSDVLTFNHLDGTYPKIKDTAQLGEWTGSEYVYNSFIGDDEGNEEEEQAAIDKSRLELQAVARCGMRDKSYLLHTWWDMSPLPISAHAPRQMYSDASRGTPPLLLASSSDPSRSGRRIGMALENFDGRTVEPSAIKVIRRALARLRRFLSHNTVRLLRDLMSVVDLRNVNHENICVLNTAIVIFVFAHRRSCLPQTVGCLKVLYEETALATRASAGTRSDGGKRRPRARLSQGEDDEVAEESYGSCGCSHMHRSSSTGRYLYDGEDEDEEGAGLHGGGSHRREDFLVNFRELLWFWREYYEHRGRDRLSLEFSSHIRFPEWKAVVDLLCTDTDKDTDPPAPACLVSRRATTFPRSPYSLPPRRPRTSIRLD